MGVRDVLEVVPRQTKHGMDKSPGAALPGGVELLDLLTWQQNGDSLATRVTAKWRAFGLIDGLTGLPFPSLISLLEERAEQHDGNAVGTATRLLSLKTHNILPALAKK